MKAKHQWIAALAANAASMLEQRPPPCPEKEEQHVDDTWLVDLFLQANNSSGSEQTAWWEGPQLLQKTASINVGPSLHLTEG